MIGRTRSGTREWSVASANCLRGCEHDCRYCYARANALRFKQIESSEEWSRPVLRDREVRKIRRKHDGWVMFPTKHDITPAFLEPCLSVIGRLLTAGNRVLVVSKPHLETMRALRRAFRNDRDRILVRFTIGTYDEETLGYWEPGAPTFSERLFALTESFGEGWSTSVSCEPLLNPPDVFYLFQTLERLTTDTIWIGAMNKIRQRCTAGTSEEAIRAIEAGQTPERIREIYEALNHHPKIRWKDSYRKALGI